MTTVVLAAEINLPQLDYAAMSPMLILFAAACVGVLVEAYVPRDLRHPTQFVLSIGALIGSVAAIVRMAGSERRNLLMPYTDPADVVPGANRVCNSVQRITRDSIDSLDAGINKNVYQQLRHCFSSHSILSSTIKTHLRNAIPLPMKFAHKSCVIPRNARAFLHFA